MDEIETHIKEIEATIKELNTLPIKIGRPKDEAKYLGTVLANTIAFLSSGANSLDNGKRLKIYRNLPDWIELMKAVNRSFYTSIIISTERGLDLYISKKGGRIESSQKRSHEKKYNSIRVYLTDESAIKFDKFVRDITKNIKPTFADYLDEALRLSSFDKIEKTSIRNFFSALVIVRNKSSHSDPTLTEGEKATLRKGGFLSYVSENGRLVASHTKYYELAAYINDFFESLT